MDLSKLKRKLKQTVKQAKETIINEEMLSTGSTLLNCALSGDPFAGWMKGKYYLIVGDSASGKTALSLTCLAEACLNRAYDDYDLIHDDAEGGAVGIEQLFGPQLHERLETVHSSSLDDMYFSIDDRLKSGKPFIWITDSTDVLETEEEDQKFQERKKAHRKGTQTTGTFGVSKAKSHSTHLRRLMTPLRETGSILIFINQTRDNLGFGFDKKTRSGGRALRFYATLEIWSSIKGKIKKKVRGKDRTIGIRSKIDIKKNRLTGREGSIEVPIYYSLGFDDLQSCVDYLIKEKHWKKGSYPEFDFEGTTDELIKYIEENNRQRKLQRLVGKVWKQIELATKVERKNKYK